MSHDTARRIRSYARALAARIAADMERLGGIRVDASEADNEKAANLWLALDAALRSARKARR